MMKELKVKEQSLFLCLPTQLLASPQVASRVYRGQMEQLLGLYHSQTAETGGQMDLSLFPAVANPLLLMIYQNAYPDVVSPFLSIIRFMKEGCRRAVQYSRKVFLANIGNWRLLLWSFSFTHLCTVPTVVLTHIKLFKYESLTFALTKFYLGHNY